MSEIARGSRWWLARPFDWQLYPVGSMATVTGTSRDAVGYRYENGAQGVLALLDFSRCFDRA